MPIQNRLLIRDRMPIDEIKTAESEAKLSIDVYLTEDQKDWTMDLLSLNPFLLG